mmetsp:Transcript_96699/g.118463  ORF Transcript_96699/g.118463 Transcript_96699/m.118463 type:complete len:166 (-) Transcript_96699:19-516(-)
MKTLSLMKTQWDLNDSDTSFNYCVKELNPEKGGVQGWGGDFVLLNRYHVFNHYIGGFLETCSSRNLDSEFIARQIHINGLQPYTIRHACSYTHIYHARKNRTLDDPCYQSYPNYLWKYIWERKKFVNDTRDLLYINDIKSNWHHQYRFSHQTWGFKNITFQYSVY